MSFETDVGQFDLQMKSNKLCPAMDMRLKLGDHSYRITMHAYKSLSNYRQNSLLSESIYEQ